MDLQKLRPAHSQWRTPLGPVAESRKTIVPVPPPTKKLQEPLKGKGGELWTKFYNDAVSTNHPMPEKLADTMLRSREHALKIEADRHKLLVTDKKPGKAEAAVENVGTAAAKKKAVLHEALRCKARTLEGRQCGFKSTCGEFCKKHAII